MKKLWQVLFVIWIVNFFAYLIVASVLGGEALDGKAEAGRYYLYNKTREGGRFHEVDQSVYIFSIVHSYSLIIPFPFLACGAVIVEIQRRKKVLSD